ncbi:MAG: CDP-alcohol phosphatidyltransferase family protein [Chloroflexi bacterium]|nr:CDP-alcohol phosphatidyltransferase family protein [Chloroflexota bacterium]
MEGSSVSVTSNNQRPRSRLAEARKGAAHYLSQPLARLLARTGVTPNALTWLGLLLSCGAAVLIALKQPFAAGFVVLVAGLFDMLDGALARYTGQSTRFGAILDSTLDRLGESAVLLGILILFVRNYAPTGIIIVGFTLPGALMVSYLRARTEAAGLAGEAGFFTRTERVIILSLGLLLSSINYALMAALGIIAFFSYLTVVQRLLNARQQTKGN